MTKESTDPKKTFVNDNRKEAAKWMYQIVGLTPNTDPSRAAIATRAAEKSLNQLAAEGWEPCLMSGETILLRRDVTAALEDSDEQTRVRAALVKNLPK